MEIVIPLLINICVEVPDNITPEKVGETRRDIMFESQQVLKETLQDNPGYICNLDKTTITLVEQMMKGAGEFTPGIAGKAADE